MCALFALLGLNAWRPMMPAAARTAEIGTALVLLLTMILNFRNGEYTNSRRLSRIGDSGRFPIWCLAWWPSWRSSPRASSTDRWNSPAYVGTRLCIFFLLAVSRLILAMRQRALFMQGVAFRRVLVLGAGRRPAISSAS